MYCKAMGIVGVVLLSAMALPAQAVPQLVRADATEQRERCLAAGGRIQGSQFDGVLARADLNGDGRLDYVLSDARVVCQGLKTARRTENRAVKIVIGTRDGRGRLAYEGAAVSAKLERAGRLPIVALRMAGSACSNDLSYYARSEQPVCWRNLVWRPYLNRFELRPIKRAKPQLYGS